MARANRHFVPGYIWHITHRCHKQEYLFKFSRDRNRWLQLLFEARKRYDLSIFNYMITSNHIHLIVSDNGHGEIIQNSIQFIAGRVAQEYNQRKNRKGAFWQDRYHATAIESGDHLWQCLVYVDLNMARAGVVKHPDQWSWSGYNEIQRPRKRYRIIDHARLQQLLNVDSNEQFAKTHRQWVNSKLAGLQRRQPHFSQSIAVGSKEFVTEVEHSLGYRAKGRKIDSCPSGAYQLREPYYEYRRSSSSQRFP